jgi:hypothetical protein
MEEVMMHSLRISGAAPLPELLMRVVDVALRGRLGARTRERHDRQRQTGSLSADIMRDIGAARQFQGYAASVAASSEGRLYRIADAGRSASPH